jgi:uncharacterized protein
MAIIRELNIYPLKSGRAVPKEQARLGTTGFEWDRHWMAASPEGVFMSQRTQPRLALVESEIGADELTLRAPGQSALHVPLRPEGPTHTARVWKDDVSALDHGDVAARWLTQAVGSPARLLRVSPALDRHANAAFAGTVRAPVAFPDGFPILVCNVASLEHLNSRMPEPIPMERFRPNLVLEGLEPFEEDRIAELHFGAVTLRLVKPCTRCVVTSTDQRTGLLSTNPFDEPFAGAPRLSLRQNAYGRHVRRERGHRSGSGGSSAPGCDLLGGARRVSPFRTSISLKNETLPT